MDFFNLNGDEDGGPTPLLNGRSGGRQDAALQVGVSLTRYPEVFCWKNFEKLWQVFNDPIDEFQSPPVENSVTVVCLSVSKGYRSCSDLGRVKQVKFG